MATEGERLITACEQGDVGAVSELLLGGINVNFQTIDRITPLHIAAVNGHAEIAHLLLDFGADPNAENQHLNTPLHNAAAFGQTEVARLLIKFGADPLRGKTPFDLARRYQPANHELLDLLQQPVTDPKPTSRIDRKRSKEPCHLRHASRGLER